MDDLHAVMTGCDSFRNSDTNCGSAMPVVEDIRCLVRQVKSEIGSWSIAAAKNTELLNCVTRDLKSLSSLKPSDSDSQQSSTNQEVLTTPSSLDPSSLKNTSSTRPRRRRHRRMNNQPEGSATASSGLDMDSHLAPQSSSADVPASLLALTPSDNSVQVEPSVGNIGIIDEMALRPAVLPKRVFVTRIHPDTTESDVICHISSRCGIPQEVINCNRIDRLRNNAGSLSASFKIVIPEASFNKIMAPDVWPSGAIVREFVPKHRSGSNRSVQKNLSANCPSITQT